MKKKLPVAAGWLALLLTTPAFAQFILMKYKVQSTAAFDVQLATVDESIALDMNDAGDFVGYAINSSGVTRAFLYQYSFMYDIGPTDSNTSSVAHGINNSGEVVGDFWTTGIVKPFYWHVSSGVVEMKRVLFPGAGWNNKFEFIAQAINDSGLIVGLAWGVHNGPGSPPVDGCHEYLSVRWTTRSANPSRLFCNSDSWPSEGANDVNESGEITGYSYDEGDGYQGYVWSGGHRFDVPPPPGGYGVRPEAINESGTVVGTERLDRAVLWDRVSDQSLDLGHFSGADVSEAFDINDSNFVAGYSEINTTAHTERAFIWHADFGMFGLPIPAGFNSSTTNCRAYAINNRVSASGLIRLAGYCMKNGKMHAVRWEVTVNRALIGLPSPY